MSVTRVLIVNPTRQSDTELRSMLIARGFEVCDACGSQEVLKRLGSESPNIVLLNPPILDVGSIGICSEIRLRSEVPIIFLSASNIERRTVEALEGGADDCLARPFGMEELVARIHARIRRAGVSRRRTVALGNVEVDLESHEVKRGVSVEHLTAREFKLFHYLVSHAGTIILHYQLLQAVWGPDYGDEVEYLRVYVNQLRKKVEPNPTRPQYILTEPREGYRFVEQPELEPPSRKLALQRVIGYSPNCRRARRT